jgi:hypothetical protein
MSCLAAEPSANEFDISPDGEKNRFLHDPDKAQNAAPRMALAEIELKGSRVVAVRDLVKNKDWDLAGPSYSHTGQQLAFLASHQSIKHTQPSHLALLELQASKNGKSKESSAAWKTISAKWDREPQVPLKWSEDDSALLCKAEDKGRQHVWRFDIASATPSVVSEGGTVHAFDEAAGQMVTLMDRAVHPEGFMS